MAPLISQPTEFQIDAAVPGATPQTIEATGALPQAPRLSYQPEKRSKHHLGASGFGISFIGGATPSAAASSGFLSAAGSLSFSFGGGSLSPASPGFVGGGIFLPVSLDGAPFLAASTLFSG